jgi:hypothetical protein
MTGSASNCLCIDSLITSGTSKGMTAELSQNLTGLRAAHRETRQAHPKASVSWVAFLRSKLEAAALSLNEDLLAAAIWQAALRGHPPLPLQPIQDAQPDAHDL